MIGNTLSKIKERSLKIAVPEGAVYECLKDRVGRVFDSKAFAARMSTIPYLQLNPMEDEIKIQLTTYDDLPSGEYTIIRKTTTPNAQKPAVKLDILTYKDKESYE